MRVLFLSLIIAGSTAHAGLLFEPYAGYTMGDYQTVTKNLVPVTNNAHSDGFAYGGTLGWLFGRFLLAGEYQAARADIKFDGSSESTSWNNQSVFGVLGIYFGMGLRLTAGMTVQPHESELASTPERTKYTGSAQKFGLGYHYRGIPFAVNGDYIVYKMDKVESGQSKMEIKDTYSKFKYSTIMLSISFPFEL